MLFIAISFFSFFIHVVHSELSSGSTRFAATGDTGNS